MDGLHHPLNVGLALDALINREDTVGASAANGRDHHHGAVEHGSARHQRHPIPFKPRQRGRGVGFIAAPTLDGPHQDGFDLAGAGQG